MSLPNALKIEPMPFERDPATSIPAEAMSAYPLALSPYLLGKTFYKVSPTVEAIFPPDSRPAPTLFEMSSPWPTPCGVGAIEVPMMLPTSPAT